MLVDFITDFVREILMVWPGAFIRWVWFGRKKAIIEIANEDSIYNYIISIILIIIIATTIALL